MKLTRVPGHFFYQPYGSRIVVGYNENSQDVCINPNIFDIRYCGPWHWTIDDTNQNQGLLAYGIYQQGDTIIPVRYQYLIVETNAYKYGGGEFLEEYDWVAILPYAWDGQGSQVDMYPRVTAQDQDRLINVQASDLKVEKKWGKDGQEVSWPTEITKVYFKIYRYKDKNANGEPEDYTNYIGTSIGKAFSSLNGETESQDGYVEAGRFYYPDSSSKNRSLVLDAQNPYVTVEHMLLMSVDGDNARTYYYFIKECGYQLSDKTDVFFGEDECKLEAPSYSTDSENTVTLNNNKPGEGYSQVITLGAKGKNQFTITNTPPTPTTGSLVVEKALAGGSSAADTDVFTFQITLKNSDGTDYAGELKVTDKDHTEGATVSVTGGQLTVSVIGAASATIGNIPDGTTYEVAEINLPDGWQRVGEVNYHDGDKVISAGESKTKLLLSGAEFSLRRKGTEGYAAYPDAEHNIGITDANGSLTFDNLPDGEYVIREEKAPDGYYLTKTELWFSITDGEVSWTNETGDVISQQAYVSYVAKTDTENATFIVGNTPGVELPATGGSGTMMYTLGGLMLMLLAGALLISRKRKFNR